MNIKTLFVLIMLLPLALHSQSSSKLNFKIKGSIVDSATSKSIPYATISVLKLPENTVIKRLASSNDGSFEIMLKDTGNFQVSIQMIGYSTIFKKFNVNKENTNLDLGKIVISETANTLNEVSIVADKPLIKVDADKISYSTDADPESKTSNVLDMLRKVPLVSVDGDDNIQLKGSSNFKIFLNGKPSTMLSNNSKDVLKNMPASTVKNIEVITSPGAKYDAEGIGGIINIITTKKSVNGYSGSVSVGAGIPGRINSSAYIAANFGKFTFSTNISGNYRNDPETSSESYRENFNSDVYKYTYYNGKTKRKAFWPWGNGELSYEIDTLNLISASFNFWYGRPVYNSNTQVNIYDLNNQLFQSYEMNSSNIYQYGSPEGNIDYQHTFKKNKAQILTISYKINHNPSSESGESEYLPALNYYQSRQKSSTQAFTTEQTFQTDYVQPFTEKHQLEMGLKYILRQNKSISEYYLYDYNSEQYSEDLNRTDFKYIQKIYAAYASYNLKYKKLSLKTGLRVESANTDGSISAQDTTFANSSLEYVPSANISYQISDKRNLKLSYNLRIQRPDIYLLNPYINKLDNKNINTGNPDLEPERYNNIELNFGSFGKKLNLNVSLFYSNSNNSIDEFVKVIDSVTYTTYYNIGKVWNTGISLYGALRFGQKFSINFNGSLRYTNIASKMEGNMKNSGWGGNISSNIQYSFGKGFKLSSYGGAYFNGPGLQYTGSPFYYCGLSLNKMFLKDKLTISLSTNNPFWREMKYTYEMKDPAFYTKASNYRRTQSFGVNITFRFGEMQGDVKKAQRGINNDDVKSGGKGGGE